MLYNEESGDMTLTATGDLLITRRVSPYTEPDYLEIFRIIRSSQVRFTNLEMSLHDYRGNPSAESGGTYCVAEPYIVEELKWAGFNLVARANNHTLDYGPEGLLATNEVLDRAGLVHAGAGRNMAEARMPAYLDTPAGRVAMLSASSSFANSARAGHSRPDSLGRPGLNALRHVTYYAVDEASLEKIKQVSDVLGFEEMKRRHMRGGEGPAPKARENEFYFLQNRFVTGGAPGVYTEAHKTDTAEITRWIADAKRQADWVLLSLHAHDQDVSRDIPAKFIQPFAHECIDAGATAFIGHGPHILRGIEIYHGAPVFYSLGNFVFQNETVRKLPADMYERYGLDSQSTPADLYDARTGKDTQGFPANRLFWESVLPFCEWKNHRLVAIRLFPLTLGFGRGRTLRGRPVLARGELAEKIIADVSRLSQPYSTQIEYRDGVGVVTL